MNDYAWYELYSLCQYTKESLFKRINKKLKDGYNFKNEEQKKFFNSYVIERFTTHILVIIYDFHYEEYDNGEITFFIKYFKDYEGIVFSYIETIHLI